MLRHLKENRMTRRPKFATPYSRLCGDSGVPGACLYQSAKLPQIPSLDQISHKGESPNCTVQERVNCEGDLSISVTSRRTTSDGRRTFLCTGCDQDLRL